MSRRDPWETIGSVAVGIIGGVALAEILKNLMKKRCIYCNSLNESNQDICKFCGGRI